MTRRVLGAIVLVAALAVVGFGIPLALAVSHRYHDDALVRLQREATSAAIQVPASAFSTGDPVELPAASAGTRLAVYDPTGRRLQGDGPSRLDAAAATSLQGHSADASSGGELVVTVPISSEERVIAVVRAARDTDAIADQVHGAWLAMATLAVAVLAGATLVGTLLARRLGRPLQRLATTATRLGDGDFTVRPVRSGIAEIDAVDHALEVTAGRLDRALQQERAFSADASHQLRTPLAGLRLQLETALEQPDDEPATRLHDALAQVDRLETTIHDLLALRRDGGPPREPLDIVMLLDELEARWRGPLAAVGRPLRIRIDDEGLPQITASAAAARQVLDVLVGNALEHGAGPVEVVARNAGGGVALEVTDAGPGVPADRREAVFARRGADHDRGIGLPLARALAEAEGGRLILRSETVRCTFAFVLPPDTSS